jgi:glycosyl hydrolase family 26
MTTGYQRRAGAAAAAPHLSRRSRRDRRGRRNLRAAFALGCIVSVLTLAACGGGSHPAASGSSPASSKSAQGGVIKAPTVDMSRLLRPPAGKYFGVEADGPPASLGQVSAFARLAGRRPDLIGQYVGWNAPFDVAAARAAWSYGALYYMAWEPFDMTLSAIASGQSNRYISQFARQVKAADIPIAISFGHEMNGNWYPWGSSDASPASFVAAWRLIHAIFASEGATRVIWIWNPNVISASPVPLQPYYPGDAYVDWIGLTGYFPMSGPTTFAELFGPTMTEIRQFTGKPFIVVETAVQSGPDELECTRQLVSGVLRRKDVLGLVWFEYDKAGVDWSLADRPTVQATFAKALTSLHPVNVKKT